MISGTLQPAFSSSKQSHLDLAKQSHPDLIVKTPKTIPLSHEFASALPNHDLSERSLSRVENPLKTVQNPASTASLASQMSSAEFLNTEKCWMTFGKELDEMVHGCTTNQQGMPCMKQTSEIILSEVNKFISSHWLSEADKTALSNYQSELMHLHEKGFPYEESLTLNLIFPIIQATYYFLSEEHLSKTEQENIRLSGLNKVGKRWQEGRSKGTIPRNFDCSINNLLSLDWGQLLQPPTHKNKALVKTLLGVGNALLQPTNLITMEKIQAVLCSAKGQKLIVPLFGEFSFKLLNLCHHTGLVPVNLTLKIKEHHDGFDMSCMTLPYHDIWHELGINSGCLGEDSERLGGHLRIIRYYNTSQHVSPEVHKVGEMIITQLCHEFGAGTHPFGKTNSSYLKDHHDCWYTAASLPCLLTNRWSDTPETFKQACSPLNLAHGAAWLNRQMACPSNTDCTFIDKWEETKLEIESSAREFQNKKGGLKKDKTYSFQWTLGPEPSSHGVSVFSEKHKSLQAIQSEITYCYQRTSQGNKWIERMNE